MPMGIAFFSPLVVIFMDEPGPNGSVEKLKQGGQRVIVILFKDTSQTALGLEAPLLE